MNAVQDLKPSSVRKENLTVDYGEGQDYAVLQGRIQLPGSLTLDATEYLSFQEIPPEPNPLNVDVQREAYRYHLTREEGPNICRFDGPHSGSVPGGIIDAKDEDHGHHDSHHVHIYTPELERDEKIRWCLENETPTLIEFIHGTLEWHHSENVTNICGETISVEATSEW